MAAKKASKKRSPGGKVKPESLPWHKKIMNCHQVAGIETSVIDDGLGKGCRIAWINTGSGLRYKIVIDRCMDIVDAFFNQHSLTWLSHAGIQAPRPDACRGMEWLWGWPGGLVTTCGLGHAGAPKKMDEYDDRGLHGRASHIMASIESILQPDPVNGMLDFSITGYMKESKMFGPNLEMKRVISGRVGEPFIRIQDTVMNKGTSPVEHMLLYHVNFGWPLIDEGTDIIYNGTCRSFGRESDDMLFSSRHNYKKCPAPMDAHRGTGESCGLIDVTADKDNICTVGLYNRKKAMAICMQYSKKQLPYLTNWQHWGIGDYVTGIEPGTHPPFGQEKVRKIKIAPGKSIKYDLTLTVLTEREPINAFLKKAMWNK